MIPENLYGIWPPMANHLWQSTLFAAMAWILTLALRTNQARIRYCLWLSASLKFLLPFSLLVSLGNYLARLNGSGQSPLVFYFVMQRVSQPFNQASSLRTPLLALLPQILAALWLAGFAVALGVWWLRWRRAGAAIRGAVASCTGRELDALRRRERIAGMRRPIALCFSQSSTEPGIFGITRPILLWPTAISDRFADAHLDAILAHEVEHVRRRDNLAAAMHMLVEAIFWFHPLVWWLGARLIEERERACDEEVLRLGSSPEVYAESILKTCEFCVASPLPCISGVTGADLKRRIVRIMTQHAANKLTLSRKLLLVAFTLGVVGAPVIVGLVKTPLVRAESPQEDAGSKPTTVESTGTIRTPVNHSAFPQPIYRIGGDVSAPNLVYAPDPEFTEKARRAKYQGVCVVSLTVDQEGNPQRIQIVRHLGMGLDKKAVEAVRQYRFTPAMRFGKPVDVEVHIEVNFRIY